MNFKLILHFAKILALASVRSKRVNDSTPKGFSKSPRINIIFGVASFVVATIVAYFFSTGFLADLNLAVFVVQIAIFLPSIMTLMAVMYGVLYEFSQSSSVGSSDVINWLPIYPIEFVLASALSMLYFLAPLIGIVYGAVIGLSLSTNMLDVGLFGLAVSTLGLFLGTFTLEIMRAITNRVSSTVYKRTGRTTVIVRMVMFVLIFVVYMLLTNVNFLFSILNQFMGGIQSAWFIPVLWPSLAVMSYLSTQVLELLVYSLLSVVLTLLLLWTGVKFRHKYWVPVPFAINLTSSKPYSPKQGLLGTLGFSAAESAIIRKDFRGLIRRKEMMVWIAVPLGISVISFFSTQSALESAVSTIDRLALFSGPLIGVFMFTFYISLTAIGQEGNAFMNLLITPLKENEIVKAKILTALIPSVCALTLIIAVIQLIIQLQPMTLVVITVALFSALFESAFVGLVVGSKFPDFNEVPRARFINQKGVWLGMLLIAGCVAVTFLPLILYVFGSSGFFPIFAAPLISATVGVVVCYVSYLETINSLQKLMVDD
ncbi:MAG: hypothetical protein IAX21_00140 [Candidatus Bathyarchaeota archaeon]|nr:MAG: hypothetical protein IAX21_00140 [Candidatus Bathyarchaeota archaeon]